MKKTRNVILEFNSEIWYIKDVENKDIDNVIATKISYDEACTYCDKHRLSIIETVGMEDED